MTAPVQESAAGGERSRDGVLLGFLRDSSWMVAASLGSKAVAASGTFLMAKILGTMNFGVVGSAQSASSMFLTMACMGLGMASTKHLAEENDPAKAGEIIAMTSVVTLLSGALFALLLAGLSDTIASQLLHKEDLGNAIIGQCPLLFFSAVNGGQIGVLLGFREYRASAVLAFSNAFLVAVLGCLGAQLHEAQGALLGMGAGQMVTAWLYRRAIRRACRDRGIKVAWSRWRRQTRILTRYALPGIAGGMIGTTTTWVGSALLVRQQDGLIQMGILNAADQWRLLVLALPTVLGSVVFPSLSRLKAYDPDGFIKLLQFNILLNAGIGCVVVVLAALTGDSVMSMLGPGYRDSGDVVVVMTAAATVVSLVNLVSRAAASVGRMRDYLLFDIVWSAAYLVFSVLLVGIRQEGALGLAKALFCASATQLLAQGLLLANLRGDLAARKGTADDLVVRDA